MGSLGPSHQCPFKRGSTVVDSVSVQVFLFIANNSAPDYAGIVFGICNTLGTAPDIVSPYIVDARFIFHLMFGRLIIDLRFLFLFLQNKMVKQKKR